MNKTVTLLNRLFGFRLAMVGIFFFFFFLWFDLWHPLGYLFVKYGHRVVYDSGFPVGAKLSTIIRDIGDWHWPIISSVR